MYVAPLCLATLVAGLLCLRNPPGEMSTAIRVDSAGRSSPAPVGSFAPQTPAPAEAISLPGLVWEIRARAITPTTRRRVPVTTTTPAPLHAAAPPGTTPLTPLTTLLEKVFPPAAAVAVTKTDSGVASWFGAPAATCAHRTLPMGTMVKVVRKDNSASATCKVDDRGPTLETGRMIDLSLDTFEKLAPGEAGLIDVRIEW